MAGGGSEGSGGGRQRPGRAGAGPGEAALPTRSPPPPSTAAARRGPGRAGGRRGLAGGGRRGRECRGAGHAGRWALAADPGARTGGRRPHAGAEPGQPPSGRGSSPAPGVPARTLPRSGVPSGALWRWCFGKPALGPILLIFQKKKKKKKKNEGWKALISVPPQWVKWRRGSKTPVVTSTSKSTRTNKALQ